MFSKTNENGFIQTTTPSIVYEIESLIIGIERFIIDEGLFTQANYPFTIKPKFSTFRSFMEISPQGPIISFMFDDSIGDLLRFHANIS